MEILISFAKAFFIIVAVVSLGFTLVIQRNNLGFAWQIWRRFRPIAFLEALGIVIATLAVAIFLLTTFPIMGIGWLNLFFPGGGNVWIAPIIEGSKSQFEIVRLLVPLFFLVFELVIPFLANLEEKAYRQGYTRWGPIAKQSVKFGLVHLLVGVPLAGGLALIISGFFYGFKYKRCYDKSLTSLDVQGATEQAVLESTTFHAMYNTIVIGFLFAVTLYVALS